MEVRPHQAFVYRTFVYDPPPQVLVHERKIVEAQVQLVLTRIIMCVCVCVNAVVAGAAVRGATLTSLDV